MKDIYQLSLDEIDAEVARIEGISGADNFSPTRNWAHGGPIIEREKIELLCFNSHPYQWEAQMCGGSYMGGGTPLIAAMRELVSTKSKSANHFELF